MKNKFEKPRMEKIEFEAEDIIVTSGGCNSDSKCPTNCSDVCTPHCFVVGDTN